jgi:branched-chain amino acid transport system ATP-binding protein
MTALLEVRGLSAGYGSFQTLFDISFEVRPGEAVAVIGPNGAGKTTLLRAVSKQIEATRGQLFFKGQDFTRMPAHEVVSLGISHVPEGRRLFPRLSVADNLRMGAFPRSARAHYDKRLAEVHALFPRLKERADQLAGTMSGGEQQMCAIGRAMMSGPQLLLLDEPSAGLAPVMVQSMFELVRQIRSAGYTVLIVEQNIRQVLKVVDRAYLLEAGQLRRSGSADELLASDEVRKVYLGVT